MTDDFVEWRSIKKMKAKLISRVHKEVVRTDLATPKKNEEVRLDLT